VEEKVEEEIAPVHRSERRGVNTKSKFDAVDKTGPSRSELICSFMDSLRREKKKKKKRKKKDQKKKKKKRPFVCCC
jgi:hypothetical protein